MSSGVDLARIEQAARRGLTAAGALGVAVLVRGERVEVVRHGSAGQGAALAAATPFHICSCSKTFTAAVFSRLVQDGAVAWDQPVQEVVPEFVLADGWASRHCTFRDLASLRVGLGRAGLAEWGIRQDLPRTERLARARHMPLEAPFRSRFAYSNLCYIALALAAERSGGKPYPELVRELLCEPLGMTDTCSAGFGVVPPPGAVQPRVWLGAGMGAVRELTGPNSEGSARIHLSGRDAGRWMQWLLAALGGSDQGPLTAATVSAMAAPQAVIWQPDVRMAPESGGWCSYGMGLFVTTLRGRPLLRHGGGGRGWRHAMVLAPDASAGVMLMTAAESPAVDGLALELIEALMGEVPRHWADTFSRAAEAAAMIERRVLDERFPADAGAPSVPLQSGRYANPVAGEVRVETGGPAARVLAVDGPDFNASATSLGGEVFRLDFDEPALSPQPLDPPFRLRVVDASTLEHSYLGRLERIA